MIRTLLLALALLGLPAMAAQAQSPDMRQQQADGAEPEAVAAKMNAYVALMNRTLRASESIERYRSWVDMDKGPVNKNRAFGVYELYDVTDLIADATDALGKEPKLAALDPSMKAYLEAYSRLAPIIDEANSYYESKDYLDDNLARGREIHTRLVPAAKTFLAAREKVEKDFQAERARLALMELAAIEAAEGRKANWHRVNLMLAARRIVDHIPDDGKPVIDMASFEENVAAYGDAYKEFVTYKKADPQALRSMQGALQSFLAASRELREAIRPAKGDLRKAGGQELQRIINAYNALVGSANNAVD